MSGERQRLDNLFTIALMLLSVLAVAELQYAAKTSSDIRYSFWILTQPIALLIFAWLLKELVQRKGYEKSYMLLTEFCWYLWIATSYYFLNYFYQILIGFYIAIWILSLIPFGILFLNVRVNYKREFLWTDCYFTSWENSIVVLLVAIGIMVFYALPFYYYVFK